MHVPSILHPCGTEALQLTGSAAFAEPVWWRVGQAKLQGEDLNYLVRDARALDLHGVRH